MPPERPIFFVGLCTPLTLSRLPPNDCFRLSFIPGAWPVLFALPLADPSVSVLGLLLRPVVPVGVVAHSPVVRGGVVHRLAVAIGIAAVVAVPIVANRGEVLRWVVDRLAVTVTVSPAAAGPIASA